MQNMRLGALLLAVALAGASLAQNAATGKREIEVTADDMLLFQAEFRAELIENAFIKSGDLRMVGDHVDVFFAKTETGEMGDVIRIEAQGNVIVTEPNRSAKADRAVYDVENEIAEFYDNVLAKNGANVIRGDYLRIELKTGMYQVKGNAQGVLLDSVQ